MQSKKMHSDFQTRIINDIGVLQLERGSDVFILGSGPSIGDLGHAQYDTISGSLSIAVGHWILNDFIPDVYYHEGTRDKEGRDLWRSNVQIKADKYSSTKFIIPKSEFIRHNGIEDIELLHTLFADNVNWIAPFYLVTRSSFSLILVTLLRRFNMLDHCLVHFRSSISIALDLASRLKNTCRIILLGVDLYNKDYFWHQQGIKYRATDSDKQEEHTTTQRIGSSLSVDEYIKFFNKEVLKPAGIELLVGSHRSKLATFLQVWHASD